MFSDLIDITSWSPDGRGYHPFDHDALHDVFVERVSNESTDTRPHVLVYGPVYSQLGNLSSPIAGILFGQLAFDFYFGDLLPDGVNGRRKQGSLLVALEFRVIRNLVRA